MLGKIANPKWLNISNREREEHDEVSEGVGRYTAAPYIKGDNLIWSDLIIMMRIDAYNNEMGQVVWDELIENSLSACCRCCFVFDVGFDSKTSWWASLHFQSIKLSLCILMASLRYALFLVSLIWFPPSQFISKVICICYQTHTHKFTENTKWETYSIEMEALHIIKLQSYGTATTFVGLFVQQKQQRSYIRYHRANLDEK